MSIAGYARAVRRWFADSILRRIFKNAGLLLTGRATTGLLGLGVLSLSAHGLGILQFGTLVLVQTYVQVVTAFATFQSWQAVIRYGAISLEAGDTPALQSLVKFTTVLDVSGVILGTAVGWFAAPLIGPVVGWTPEIIHYAQGYSLLVLFTMVATPTGLLRLFDRFDLLALQSVITPLIRLVGVGLAVALQAPLWIYLGAWFVAGAAGGLMLLWLGWREARRQGALKGLTFSLRGIAVPHPGLGRFALISSAHAALQVITGQMSVFLVGIFAGPAAAGLFKVARDVATALSRPAELLTQSIYPEFARLGSRGGWHAFAALVLRGGAVAGMAGAAMVAITVMFGDVFLGFFFGPAFAAAYLPLVLLVGAAAITICGFPMDPALYAMGRAGIPLRVNTVVILGVYLPLLVVLTRRYGADGAAAATLTAASLTFVAMVMFTARQLRRRAHLAPQSSEAGPA